MFYIIIVDDLQWNKYLLCYHFQMDREGCSLLGSKVCFIKKLRMQKLFQYMIGNIFSTLYKVKICRYKKI